MKVALKRMLIAAVVVASIFISPWALRNFIKPKPISTKGGELLSIKIPCQHFSQVDLRWKSDELGNSSGTVGNYGCTLCCAAMSLNSLGVKCDPQSLNNYLTQNDGYTESGLLIWSSLEKFAGDGFEIKIRDHLSHAYLDKQLKQGTPMIAKVLWEGKIWHWVLLTGKEKDQYLIADPLSSNNNPHMPATMYSEGFFSVRHLK